MYVLNQLIVHVDPYNTEFHFVSVIKRNTYMYICIFIYIYRLGGYLILNSTGELSYRFLLNIFCIAPYVAETSFYEKSSFFAL